MKSWSTFCEEHFQFSNKSSCILNVFGTDVIHELQCYPLGQPYLKCIIGIASEPKIKYCNFCWIENVPHKMCFNFCLKSFLWKSYPIKQKTTIALTCALYRVDRHSTVPTLYFTVVFELSILKRKRNDLLGPIFTYQNSWRVRSCTSFPAFLNFNLQQTNITKIAVFDGDCMSKSRTVIMCRLRSGYFYARGLTTV